MLGYATASKSILHVLRFLPACLTKALNRYSVYYWSHIFMAVSFVTILLLHPLPGLPSLDELNGSIAWVSPRNLTKLPLDSWLTILFFHCRYFWLFHASYSSCNLFIKHFQDFIREATS